jgi:myosin heavy subunit
MKRPKIEISTVKNGYTLDVDGKGYMYFNVGDLLAGILAHVGMGIKEPMEEKEILEVLFGALIGSEYAQKIANMRDNIIKLEGELHEKIERVNKVNSRLREYEEIAENLNDRIDRVRADMREVENQNKEDKKLAAELTKAADSLQTKTNQLKEEIKTARQVLREIRLAEAAERRKAEETEKDEKGEKEKPKPKPKAKTAVKEKTANQLKRDHSAEVYEQKLKKRIERGDTTVFPDAGIILHHTKKKK